VSSSLRRAFIVIGLFFAVFFVAIFYTVRTAVQSYEPPTDPGYHEKGMDYQKRIDEFDRAKERGWSLKVNLFDKDSIPYGENTLTVLLEKDASKPSGEFGPLNRDAVIVIISHPASVEGRKILQFPASDFARSGNQMKMDKKIDVSLKGVAEISIEVRPDADSAIHISKKLTVM
jgi:hypothetical protein